MAVQSMTGFGSADLQDGKGRVSVELKSVNGRFLEFQCRVPRALAPLESKLKQILSKHVTRGNVTCQIQWDPLDNNESTGKFNLRAAEAYIVAAKQLQSRMNVPATLNLLDLLRLPEVMAGEAEPEELLHSELADRVLPVFESACAQLELMRAEEGNLLVQDMRKRIEDFSVILKKIKVLLPERNREYLEKVRARVHEIVGDNALVAEERLTTEIGIMAERLDVTEEVVRMEAHISQFLESLANHAAPGKRLGFLLQEMHREVNTLGTKAQYAEIQHLCVGLKEDLEIVREQVQNLE